MTNVLAAVNLLDNIVHTLKLNVFERLIFYNLKVSFTKPENFRLLFENARMKNVFICVRDVIWREI